MADFSLGDALISITGRVAPGLNNALGDAENRVKKSMGNILQAGQRLGAAMTVVGGVIVGALGAAALGAAKYGDDLVEMSQRTGLGTTFLQELGYAAKTSGTSLEGLETATKKMEKAIYAMSEQVDDANDKADKNKTKLGEQAAATEKYKEAQNKLGQQLVLAQTKLAEMTNSGKASASQMLAQRMRVGELQTEYVQLGQKYADATKKIDGQAQALQNMDPELKGAAKAIGALGLKYGDLKKLKPEDQFIMIAGKLADVRNATDRAALAQAIFGKAGTAILPMLADGAAGLDRMRKQAHDLSLVLSETEVNSLGEFNDKLDTMKLQLQITAYRIGAALIPAMNSLVNTLIPVIAGFSKWISAHQTLTQVVTVTAGALGGFMLAIGPVLMALPGLIALVGALKPAFAIATTVIKAMGPVLGTIFSAVKVLIGSTSSMGLLSLGGIVAGVSALFETFTKKPGTDFSNWITRMSDSILPGFNKALQGIFSLLLKVIESARSALVWLGLVDARPTLGAGAYNPDGSLRAPGHAAGTRFAPGGLSLVGERGPELVSLPRGAQVIDAGQTRQMLAGGGRGIGAVTINNAIHVYGNVGEGQVQRLADLTRKRLEAFAT